jgi:hypothetical protein
MRKRQLLATAAALITTPLTGLPAWAGACVSGTIGTYETAGFSCSVGPVTFSSFGIVTSTTGTGSISSPINVLVESGGGEYGLALSYSADTGTSPPASSVDVTWTYNVAANLLDDSVLSLSGTVSGTGSITANEVLSNSITLTLTKAGTTSTTFTPIASLSVIKDQNDYSGSLGSSESSVVENEFSVTTTPIPAALPLFATGLVGLWGFRRKRSKRNRLGSAQAS